MNIPVRFIPFYFFSRTHSRNPSASIHRPRTPAARHGRAPGASPPPPPRRQAPRSRCLPWPPTVSLSTSSRWCQRLRAPYPHYRPSRRGHPSWRLSSCGSGSSRRSRSSGGSTRCGHPTTAGGRSAPVASASTGLRHHNSLGLRHHRKLFSVSLKVIADAADESSPFDPKYTCKVEIFKADINAGRWVSITDRYAN